MSITAICTLCHLVAEVVSTILIQHISSTTILQKHFEL